MGCDIHAHWEVLVDNEWVHYSKVDIDRDYSLFEKMAGVRGDVNEAIALPRGLPNDVTKSTALDVKYWNGDAHSESWLSSKEMVELITWWEDQYKNWAIKREVVTEAIGYLYGNDWDSFYQYRDSYPEWVQDFRLVFWFDN